MCTLYNITLHIQTYYNTKAIFFFRIIIVKEKKREEEKKKGKTYVYRVRRQRCGVHALFTCRAHKTLGGGVNVNTHIDDGDRS